MQQKVCVLALFALLGLALRAEDKPAGIPIAELPKADADGWITLFNGKDLTGWAGDPAVWRVTDGYISGKADKVGGNTFLIFNYPFENFILEAKFVMVKGGPFPNSGIQYRSRIANPAKWVVGGYQADMGDGWYGSLYDELSRDKLLFKAPPEVDKSIKFDDWNQYKVTANGTKLKHEVNGIVGGELDDLDENGKPHPKGSLKGVIALQFHSPGGFEIKFKDIRIKLLPPTEEKK